VQFKLADSERQLPEYVHRLLAGLFSQFDMFAPKPEVFSQVLEHWKKLAF